MVKLAKRKGEFTEEDINEAFAELAICIQKREDIIPDDQDLILRCLFARRDYEVSKFRRNQLSTKEYHQHMHRYGR